MNPLMLAGLVSILSGVVMVMKGRAAGTDTTKKPAKPKPPKSDILQPPPDTGTPAPVKVTETGNSETGGGNSGGGTPDAAAVESGDTPAPGSDQGHDTE